MLLGTQRDARLGRLRRTFTPDRTPAELSAASALSDIWTRRIFEVSGSSTNCLLSEHGPSEPDEDVALYGLAVQERFVKVLLFILT